MAHELKRRVGKLEARRTAASATYQKTPEALALERLGYEAWLKTLGPRTFTGSFSAFHHQFWFWYWSVRQKLLRGEQLTPAELAALVIWFRSGGKSSNVEWCCIAEGALVGEGYVGYVSDTEDQAKAHLQSIRDRLGSPEIARYYPGLANPKIDRHGQQVGWRQDYLATACGWGIIPIGLEEGVRGGRQNDLRFTMFVFDDIDTDTDSPAAVEKKLNIISRSIIPAGTADTLVIFPQNLIHENSVLNQIYTRRSDVLSERQVFGPVPAFQNLELELDERDGGRVWRIESATPTWPDINMDDARKFLSKSGRRAFMAEYQHEFGAEKEDKVLPHYDDAVHVITWAEFAAIFGERRIPDRWYKYLFNDWARTKSAYHANVAGKVTVSGQHERLPGFVFLYDCMSFEAGALADTVALRILNSISPTVRGTAHGQTWEGLMRSALSREGLESYVADATELLRQRRATLARIFPQYVSPLLKQGNYHSFRMSHEREDVRAVYRSAFGLPFQGVNPGKDGGIEWINHYMQVDYEAQHPFRPEQKGFTRFFLIVGDDKRAYPAQPAPDHLHDSDLARYQLKHWRNSPPQLNSLGIVERGPEKMSDDIGNGLMMLFHDNSVQAAPLSRAEKMEEALPASLRQEAIAAMDDRDKGGAIMRRQMEMEKKEHERKNKKIYSPAMRAILARGKKKRY